jgi:hypothetical protein
MTTTHTPVSWRNIRQGTWVTKDGRWTASARWNSIQHDHWTLLIGDETGPQIVGRTTLKEIKAIVADAETLALYVNSERGLLQRAVAKCQAMLDEAETNERPGQGHIVQHRATAVRNAQANLDRFLAAVAAQS